MLAASFALCANAREAQIAAKHLQNFNAPAFELNQLSARADFKTANASAEAALTHVEAGQRQSTGFGFEIIPLENEGHYNMVKVYLQIIQFEKQQGWPITIEQVMELAVGKMLLPC